MASITTYVKISQESYTTQYDSMYFLQFNTELLEGNISNLYIDGVESYGSIESITRRYYVNDAEPAIHEIIVEFSDGIVPAGAFANYSGYSPIYELEIGTGIIKVGDYAFNSQKMEQVILPEADIEYGYEVFGFNANLKKVVFPKTYDITIGDCFFQSCTSLEEVDLGIQSTITTFCFCDCSSLKSLTIPSTITEIRNNSFQNCENLKELHAKSTIPPTLRSYLSFTLIATGGTLYYPAGSDYSNWLSTNAYYLGYYGWNGVAIGGYPDGSLDTDSGSIDGVSYEGDNISYTIGSSNIQSWSYENCPDWITIIGDSGTFTIAVSPNNDMPRDANITFIAEDYNGNQIAHSLYISQKAKSATFTLSQDEFTIPYYGGSGSVDVEYTNIKSWDEIDSDMVNVNFNPSTGSGRASLDFYIRSTNDESDYVYLITVYATDYNGDTVGFGIYVLQEGKPNLDGSISSATYEVDQSAQDFTFTVSQTKMSSWDVVELEQGSDYASIGSYDFSTGEIVVEINQNNTFAYRECVVYISGTDEGGTTRNAWITIQQEPNDGTSNIYVPTTDIELETGASQDIEVTYENVDNISTPEAPEGYEIEEVERTTSEDGTTTKVIYRVKKTSTGNGNATINFSGEGSDGTISSDVNITGVGVNTNPATIAYSTFYLENGVMVFDYTGGTLTLSLIADGYHKPFTVNYSISDSNSVLSCTKSELGYDDNVDYAVWDFEFAASANSTSSALEGEVIITYEDEYTSSTTTFPFHVRYENEGLIKYGSTNFKYDKEGELLSNYSYVNIYYTNISTVNTTPTYPDWMTVSEGVQQTGTYIGVDAVYRYAISVSANEGAARNGLITFTGIGEDGLTYSTQVSVSQEGEDTVVKIDEGFIELQSLSLVFPSEGGTDTFQVKYYDAAEIQLPELVGDWATIEEIDSTTEEGTAWNGTECIVTTKTYQVVATSTTNGREMKVICRLTTNDNTYFEKDKFKIYQLADGSTSLQGSISVLRYSKTYTYYGSAYGFPPKVGYKGVEVLEPTFSTDWVRVGDTTTKLYDGEYDYIYEYSLDMDVNDTPFSRSCVVTFMGNAEDGTSIISTITITQEGQEEIINEGEYDNYKGYFMDFEGNVHSISFITNPRSDVYGDIRLAGDSPVVVSYSESGRLYEPVRTSICTVKVVSSHYLMNLYTGKAHGTQVILKNEDTSTIEWVGFLQPNLYNQGFVDCMEEIEFEASDCLSTLKYFLYENHFDNGRFVIPFSYVVEDLMDKCELINTYMLTDKTFSDSYQSRTVQFKSFYISEENFFSEEGEPWTMEEVLGELCKYFGLTAFQYGDTVYFMDYDMFKDNKKMNGWKYTKTDGWNSGESVVISNGANQITAESYRETGADISLDDVFNKVSVKAEYYNVEELLPDLFEDDFLTNRFGDGTMFSLPRYEGRGNSTLVNKSFYRVYDHKNINSIYYKPVVNANYHEVKTTPTDEEFESRTFFRNFIGGNIVDLVHLNYDEANGKVGDSKDFERYLMISQLNRPWCQGFPPYQQPIWEDYNFPIMEFKGLPVVFIDNTNEGDSGEGTLTRVSSSTTPNSRKPKPKVAPNYLMIQAEAAFTVRLDSEFIDDSMTKTIKKGVNNGITLDQVREEPALIFYLEIPQKGWWNGSTWVDGKTYFEVPLEPLDYEGDFFATFKNVKNTTPTNLFLGQTGYHIPLPKEMTTTQDLYFAIGMPKRNAHCLISSGGDDTGEGGNAYTFIKNLKLSICNRNSSLWEDEDTIYENVIDEGYVEEGEDIEMKITTDNSKWISYSNVSTVTIEEKNTTNILFYNRNAKLLKAEEMVIAKYVNQYSTPSLKENLTLDMSFKPYELITDTYWDKDFVIIGQEIDYQMCKQTLTLLEKKTLTNELYYNTVDTPSEGRSNYRRRTN